MHRVLLWERLKEEDHMRDLGVDGKIILKWIFKKCNGYIKWILVLQDGDSLQAAVNVLNILATDFFFKF